MSIVFNYSHTDWITQFVISPNYQVSYLLTTLLQCFDTVGWVIRPVKTVGRITYIVLAQT